MSSAAASSRTDGARPVGRSTSRARSVLAPALVGLGALLLTLALALAFVVVPGQLKTPLDTDVTTVTDTAPGAQLVATAFAVNKATERNAGRPECKAAGETKLPMTCFMDAGVPMYSQRRVTAVDPSDADVVTLQAAQSVIRTDTPSATGTEGLVTATLDRVTYGRHDGQPVADATSTLKLLSGGDPAKDSAPAPFARKGVQYKFPFDVTQGDQDYFDASTFTTNPIHYTGESDMGGLPVYVFEQELGPIDMWQSLRAHFTETGDTAQAEKVLSSYRIRDLPAERWGLPGDPKRAVDMRRFYTNKRTLYVEPTTGQIVDGKEDIFQFFAENEAQAKALFADKAAVDAEKKAPTRTAFAYFGGWNSETIAHNSERVQGSLDTITTAGRVAPAILGVLGLLSLAAGLLLGLRRRRS